MKVVVLVILITLCGGMPLISQDSDIRFRHIGIKDGLSQSYPRCIMQDRNGYIWIGTEEGLNRYDGYNFKIYYHEPHNPNSISDSNIYRLHEEPPGIIWSSTRNGLNRFDPVTGSFTRFYHDPENPQTPGGKYVSSFASTADGFTWVGTGNGISRFDPRNGKWSRHLYSPDASPRNPNRIQVNSIWIDPAGMLWLGTRKRGLIRFDPETGKTLGLPLPVYSPEPPSPSHMRFIITIYNPDNNKNILWLGTGIGPRKFDLKKQEYIRPDEEKEPFARIRTSILDFCSLDGGRIIWLASEHNGLYRYDTVKKTITHLVSQPGRAGTLSNNTISGLLVDRTGILWVATMGMVDKYDPKSEHFGHRVINASGSGNDSEMLMGICKDRKGVVWAASPNSGLLYWNPNDNKCSRFPLENKAQLHPGAFSITKALTIIEDRREQLWVGSYGHGLFVIDPQRKTSIQFPLTYQRRNGETARITIIDQLFEDTGGFIWAGTTVGIYRIDPSSGKFRQYRNIPGKADTLVNNNIMAISGSRGNNIWIATNNGMSLFQREKDTFKNWTRIEGNPNSLCSNNLRCIWEDPQGIVWVGTNGWGLNRFDPVSRKFKHYNKQHGLPNNTIYGILQDKEGYLWMSTNKGLSRFDPHLETSRNYDAGDGLQSDEFNKNCYFKCSDGQFIFGGINGINMFYPRLIQDNPYPPPVTINSFKILNQPVDIGGNSPLKQSITTTRELELSYSDYVFSFDFSALDFTNPSKNRYKYKLEGLDDDWIDLGNKHDVTFSTLPPGDYTLRIKGSNNDGVWNEEATSLKITVTPPFWRTLWFRGLAVLLLVSGLLAWHKKTLLIQEMKLKTEAAMNRFFDKWDFTEREQEIVRLILKGKSNKEIEGELYLSLQTVKNYVTRIYKKAGVRSRTELQSKLIKTIHID